MKKGIDCRLFGLERRRFPTDFLAAFQYLKGIYKKDGNRPGPIMTGRGVMALKKESFG